MDWGEGRYELTAAELAPASAAVVDAAGLAPGETVLDVACGTGNAALEAASRGARVTGVDGAPRLLDVARDRARDAGAHVRWEHGDLLALPVSDASFDAVLSVFGVIFATDASAAAAELVRATAPGGRVVLATWVADGPIAAMMRAARAAAGTGGTTLLLDWGAPSDLEALFPGCRVTTTRHGVAFSAGSPHDYVARQDRHHPSWTALRAALSPERYAALLGELEAIVAAGNEDPDGFRVTSPYLVAHVAVPA